MQELSLFDDLGITVPARQAMQPPFQIWNRRFEGCKHKIAPWILDNILQVTGNCRGTFCDLFGGTGVMTEMARPCFDNFIINDFLYSNNIIYKAFFGVGNWNRDKLQEIINGFNQIDCSLIPDNYCSENYGNLYFPIDTWRKIGHIREEIEKMKPTLTDKEYNILMASLFYSMDRISRNCGHYDAPKRKAKNHKPLVMRLVDAQSCANVEIFREDANSLAGIIKCNVMYVDPPYNSRQYSRSYHVLENIAKWDNSALDPISAKPEFTENNSAYCRKDALQSFCHLIATANTEWLAVSYNNTENPKSKTSKNKMTLAEIQHELEKCGETKVFTHDFKPFNAGKTEFDNHKEYLFITRIDNDRRRNSFADILPG